MVTLLALILIHGAIARTGQAQAKSHTTVADVQVDNPLASSSKPVNQEHPVLRQSQASDLSDAPQIVSKDLLPREPVFYVNGETPSGAGSNFPIAYPPKADSFFLFRNDALLTPGVDYTLAAQTLTLTVPLGSKDSLRCSYRTDVRPSTSSSPQANASTISATTPCPQAVAVSQSIAQDQGKAKPTKAQKKAAKTNAKLYALCAQFPALDVYQVFLIMQHQIFVGMTVDMLRTSWPWSPDRINNTYGPSGTEQQAVYDMLFYTTYVYIDNGIVTSYQVQNK